MIYYIQYDLGFHNFSRFLIVQAPDRETAKRDVIRILTEHQEEVNEEFIDYYLHTMTTSFLMLGDQWL